MPCFSSEDCLFLRILPNICRYLGADDVFTTLKLSWSCNKTVARHFYFRNHFALTTSLPLREMPSQRESRQLLLGTHALLCSRDLTSNGQLALHYLCEWMQFRFLPQWKTLISENIAFWLRRYTTDKLNSQWLSRIKTEVIWGEMRARYLSITLPTSLNAFPLELRYLLCNPLDFLSLSNGNYNLPNGNFIHSLRYLVLTDLTCTSLDTVYRSRNLRKLSLTMTNAPDLSNDISNLTLLEVLKIWKIPIGLNRALLHLPCLKVLFLVSCEDALTEVPIWLKQLPFLEELHLYRNKLSIACLTDLFRPPAFPRLRYLNLEENCLKAIPKGLAFLPQIDVLHLANNPVRWIPNLPTTLRRCSLPDFDLSSFYNRNRIRQLHEGGCTIIYGRLEDHGRQWPSYPSWWALLRAKFKEKFFIKR